MKKNLLFISMLICMLFITQGLKANGSDGYFYYYYAKVTAKTASESSAKGCVYVSTTAASVESATAETSNATGQDPNDYGESTDAPTEAGQVKFYLYAKPASGYKFDGWSTSATRPSVFESTNPVWETTFGASTTQGSSSTTNPGGTQNSGSTASSGKTQYYCTSTAEHSVYAYFSELVLNFTVSFAQPSNGSIKVGGVSPSSWPYGVSTTTGELTTTLTATPASGYSFWGWYTLNIDGSKNYLSYDATYNATFNDATTVYAEFYDSSLALFQTAGVNFYDLNLANAKAVANGGGTIVVTKNGTVPAGNYTIASGVTLLVPLNADNQVHTEPSVVTSGTPSRSVYRTLTLANGANITLNGSICVDAIMCLTMGYNGSAMNGYGLIDMKAGSTITMKSGSNFYVWGFVIGDGSIVAESGATIHETFQFKHRGGNALSSIASTNASKKVFPINQYYIQSIEAPITFRKGATEKVYTGVHNVAEAISIDFIGTSGLFNMTGTNAYLIKKYDVSKDRQNYTLYGDATIGSIKFGMSGFSKESKNFVLPITNNMTLNVESGTTTIQYETAILPDVEVNIASGAKISSSDNCYVYDSLNWKGAYAYANDYSKAEAAQIAPVVYRHGGLKYNRKNYKLRDAAINVNGTLEGKIYTTEGGANIKSSLGTGVVKFTAALSSTTTYQAGQDGTTGKFDAYTVYPAQLHNASQWYSAPYTGDGKACEYLATAGTAANTTINYKNGHWGWMEIWKDEDGTVLKALNTTTQQSGAAPGNPTKECYTFTGWNSETFTANQEVIHTATYSDTPTTYAITYSAGANGSGTVAGGTKTCGVDFTLSSSTFTRIGYYQTGWSTEDGGAKAYELGGSYTTNAAQTFYPSWAPYVATVSVGGEDPKYYATIAEAIDAANGMSNATVTMLQNATVASEITLSAAMTIDLNGKTVSSTLVSATGVFNINASGKTITIKDSDTGGKIDHTASYSGKLYGINFTAGSLNIIGGTIYAKNTTTANNTDYRAYGIFTSSASAITMSGGMIEAHTPSNPSAFGIYAGNACTFTMTDGTIRATGTSSVRGVYLQGTTTLSDKATITATATGENSYTIFAKAGTMTINNGTYAAEGTGSAYVIFFEAGTVTVNGGKFNGSSCELTKRITAYNVILKGGVYVHETDLAAKCAANHHVFDLTSGADYDEGYRYKVAEAYTVTFNANGHGTAPESQLIVKGQNATEPSPAPTVEGYDFGGWYKEAGCTNVWNFASDVVTAATPLYAKWTLKKYTITYNKGANGTGSIAAGEKTHDVAFTLSSNKFTREGYTQTGWSTTDGGAKAYDFGESYTDNAAITLYPFWTINKYTITFKNGEEVLQSGEVEYGQTPNYSGETPTKAADAQYTYTFSGWSPAIASVTGEATYTAQFSSTVNNYTLTIATNEVNYGYVDEESVTVPYGSTVTVSGNTFTVNDITVTATPTANDADYTYAFKQWNNLPETVTGNVANIQAEFVRTPLNLDVTTHESVEATETINTTIVHENGQLEIATDKTLTTGDLIIEATPETSGEVRGTVVATNAYFDLTRGAGKVFKHHTWYAFSVPFQADAAEILFDGEKLQYNKVSKKDAYDILYYDGADRATHGSASSNWKYVENDEGAKKYLHPGVLYMIAITKRDVTKIRFTRDGGELLTTSVDVAPHAPSTGNNKDANWNGVANPALFHANMSGLGSTENIAWIYDPDAEDPTNPYVTKDLTDKKVVLGQAFFVQTPRVDPLVVEPADSDDSPLLAAPARSRGNRSTEDPNRYMVKIAKADGPEADFVIVRADEEKEENTYVLGKDLVRMGVSSIRPQLWVNRYDAKLIVNAMAPVNGQTEYPLGISAPEYGEYAIYTEAPQNDETVLYLTRDGRVIWNLNYGTYTTTLDKGTTDRYGLRIVSKAPQTATGIGEAVVDAHGETQKVLMDNQVFIIRNGEVYTTTGQKIK